MRLYIVHEPGERPEIMTRPELRRHFPIEEGREGYGWPSVENQVEESGLYADDFGTEVTSRDMTDAEVQDA